MILLGAVWASSLRCRRMDLSACLTSGGAAALVRELTGHRNHSWGDCLSLPACVACVHVSATAFCACVQFAWATILSFMRHPSTRQPWLAARYSFQQHTLAPFTMTALSPAQCRDKEHSTIIYESPQPDTPLLRLTWNKQDPRYIAGERAVHSSTCRAQGSSTAVQHSSTATVELCAV
jgi:hypothetical protein